MDLIVLIRTLKDGVNQDDDMSCQGGPLLLQAIISQTPSVFSSQPVKTIAESYQDPQGKLQLLKKMYYNTYGHN